MKRSFSHFSLAGLTLLLAGCVNLAAVRDYTKEAAATIGNKDTVALYATSEERFQNYLEESRRDPARIQERRTQVEGMLHISDVLKLYFETLATLADETMADYSKEIGVVNRGLGAITAGKLSAEQLGAARSLGQLVARLATDTARHSKLRETLRESNDDVQTLIRALRDIAQQDIISSLDTESAAVRNYYGTLASEIQNGRNREEMRAIVILLREREVELKERQAKEKAAIAGYVDALNKIAEGHDYLAKAKSFQTKAISKQLKAYEAEIKAASKVLSNL